MPPATSSTPETPKFLFARQPIVRASLEISGYELLYRAQASDDHARIGNPNQATANVVIAALAEGVLERIAGKLPVYINITRPLLLSGMLESLPNKRVILEVLEDIDPTPEVLEALRQLRAKGYTIALDDFAVHRINDPLVDIANIVKIDIQMDHEFSQIPACVQKFKRRGVLALAEKVESWEEFEALKAAGFDYFQGYFFARPEPVQGQMITASRALLLNLLTKLEKPDVGVEEIERLVSHDVALSLRILRYINSAAIGLRRKISSLREAILLLGFRHLKTLAYLSALSGIDGKPPALLTTTLVRARMCQNLAERFKRDNSDHYFLAGLFSTLDAFYNTSLDSLLKEIPLGEDITDGLLRHEGGIGEVLEYVKFYEKGAWLDDDDETSFNHVAPACYAEALEWAELTQGALKG
ncbi:MAG: HDOD domain-containing protein [Halothiobacillaceae bacterium]|jgi:EAL and modified HD-GYP domain-containing signal transduction protein|nr:HDOD domain-containing protein [Halothiobacillaceae bacterium]MDY0049960.1 HDOD domain-containing protein [Halothiobacillaceae bacterium]